MIKIHWRSIRKAQWSAANAIVVSLGYWWAAAFISVSHQVGNRVHKEIKFQTVELEVAAFESLRQFARLLFSFLKLITPPFPRLPPPNPYPRSG